MRRRQKTTQNEGKKGKKIRVDWKIKRRENVDERPPVELRPLLQGIGLRSVPHSRLVPSAGDARARVRARTHTTQTTEHAKPSAHL